MSAMLKRWRESFTRDAQRAVADLISGRAALGGAVRLGVPEFLAQEFGASEEIYPQTRAGREALDAALLGWLQQMVGDETPSQVQRLGAPVYARRLCDALVAVQWLELPQALNDLRERREWWFDRLYPWRLSSARDPGLELRRSLTLGQRDQSLLSLWLRMADDPRDEYYAVALAGLQGMPEAGDGAAIHQHCLHAALRHAALKGEIGQVRRVFKDEYAALQARYPRAPAQWKVALGAVQEAVKHSLPERVCRELRDMLTPKDVDSQATVRPAGRRRGSVVLAPVGRHTKDALAADIESRKGSGESLSARLFSLCEQELIYARHSGESYFFTRTLHNLGNRLLDNFTLSRPSLEHMGHLTEEALIWEPLNPYFWMLLAKWFGACGWQDQLEWALRESVRLFPDNEPSRVQLAILLMRRGEPHLDEAEQLLRTVIGFSPRNEPSRVQLARLLKRRGEPHLDEAEQLLRTVIEFSPRDEHLSFILATFLHGRGAERHAESRNLLEALLRSNPANANARQYIDAWFNNEEDAIPAESVGGAEDSDWADCETATFGTATPPLGDLAIEGSYDRDVFVPDSILSSNESSIQMTSGLWQAMQRIRGRGELQAAFMASVTAPGFTPDTTPVPKRLIRTAEQGDPLAGLYVQWLALNNTLEPPPYAWAWRACKLWQRACTDVTDWQNLLIEFPEHKTASRFLQSQVMGADPSVQQAFTNEMRQLAQKDQSALTTEQAFVLRLEALESVVDSGKVFDLLHCGAMATPEFDGQRLAA